MAHNVLVVCEVVGANKATHNLGERRRGNEGAKRLTDLAVVNPGGGAQSPPERIQSCYATVLLYFFFILHIMYIILV